MPLEPEVLLKPCEQKASSGRELTRVRRQARAAYLKGSSNLPPLRTAYSSTCPERVNVGSAACM